MNHLYWGIEYCVSFVEILMCFVFCGSFLNKNKHPIYLYPAGISLFGALLVVLLGMIQLFSAVNTIVIFVILSITLVLYFKSKPVKTVIILASYMSVVFITDLTIASLAATFTDTTIYGLFGSFSPERVVTAIMSKIILVAICMVFYRVGAKKELGDVRANGFFSLISIALLLISVLFYFSYSKNENDKTNIALSFLFISILMLIIAVYLGVTYYFDSRLKQQEFELARQQSMILEKSIRNQEKTFSLWQKSVHDYKNTVLALDLLVRNGETEKLLEYLENEKKNLSGSGKYIHTGNMTVDTIINTKYALAEDKGISFTVNGTMPERCVIPDVYLASLLGNLIDNAIEAETKEEEPYVDIQIASVRDFLIIKIVNKCSAPPDKNITSKDDKIHHGIGLKSVMDRVEEYNGCFELTFESGRATAKLLVPKE